MRLFTTLRAKLIVAFVGVAVVALVVASGVFLIARRGDQQQREIDRVASASPSIVGEYLLVAFRSQSASDLVAFASDAARRHNVRVILVDDSGTVIADSKGELTGKTITLPPEPDHRPGIVGRTSYVTWKPPAGTPGAGYVLLASNVPAIPVSSAQRASGVARVNLPRLVIGVPQGTIAHAWLNLLPGLAVAAAIALPVAVVLAVLVAAYITRPVKQLTVAAGQLADGTFQITVPRGRRDELGDLTEAFATMAQRVGTTQVQMRTLVASVSHDLKTPLTSILGFARALHTGAVSGEDSLRAGAIIEEEAVRLSQRLDALLLLSELDSGKAVAEREDIDLGLLAADVVRRVFPAEVERSVTVEMQAAPGVVVLGDGIKLERVVENLVDNARKFTPAGGHISVRTVAPLGSNVAVLEVANTGVDAMDAADVERLFERFYRRDRNRSAQNGTGLGLAIARDLVALQGGKLNASWCDGTLTFRVELPLEPAEPAAPAEPARAPAALA